MNNVESRIIDHIVQAVFMGVSEGVTYQHKDGLTIYKRLSNEFDRQLLAEALDRTNNNQFEAAKLLASKC